MRLFLDESPLFFKEARKKDMTGAGVVGITKVPGGLTITHHFTFF
jgi:hypothetical protein